MEEEVLAELRRAYPLSAEAIEAFSAFVSAADTDLADKESNLRQQRANLNSEASSVSKTTAEVTKEAGLRGYLSCQLFMLTRHRRRLAEYAAEANARVKSMSSVNDSLERDASLRRLLADFSKRKRRIKHVLDVTDRYCVLTDAEVATLEKERIKRSKSANDWSHRRRSLRSSQPAIAVDSDSDTSPNVDDSFLSERKLSLSCGDLTTASSDNVSDDVDGGYCDTKFPAGSSPITQHLVLSTLESLGSHLAVLAKSYTRKRGSDADAGDDAPPSPSSPRPRRLALPSPLAAVARKISATSVGV